jgi:hypothetical protein
MLSRLLDVNMQCQLRSIVSDLSTVAYRLRPAEARRAGAKQYATVERSETILRNWHCMFTSSSRDSTWPLRAAASSQATCTQPVFVGV